MDKINTIERINPIPFGAKEIFLAGGCFWGSEEYLSRIKGVVFTDVGYANGDTISPTYEDVCRGDTGFAECVRVVYDPFVLPLRRLLELYFDSVDPCSKNRQGGDVGDQYRTGIYWLYETDGAIALNALSALEVSLGRKVEIETMKLKNYFAAEEYHQKYLKKNPGGYCHIPSYMFKKAEEAN